MKEARCGICADPSAITAVAKLCAESVPLRSIASRLKIPKSSVHRHAKHAGLMGDAKKRAMSRLTSHTGRNAVGGRCTACGIDVANAEPRSLLRRAERLLHGAELVVERAAADDDFRLQLQAIDRVKSALELLMKAVGLVGGDNTVTVNVVDERKQLLSFVGSLPPQTLIAFQRGDCPHCGVSLAEPPRAEKLVTAKPALEGAI